MFEVLLACLAGYLIGAIPAGLLLTRWVAGVDLRTVGSGNPGFTNAARVLGWKIGVWVLVFDIAKGWAPALLFPHWIGLSSPATFGQELARLLIAVSPIVGHCLSVFLKFRGGKGVATSLGVFLALAPGPLLIALTVGVAIIAVTRYVSLGSMIGAVLMAVLVPVIKPGQPALIALTILLAVMIIYLHRANIGRLIRGEELPFGKKQERNGKAPR